MFHLLRSGTCARCRHRVQVSYLINGQRVRVARAWSGRCPVCQNRIELEGTEPARISIQKSPSPYNNRGTSLNLRLFTAKQGGGTSANIALFDTKTGSGIRHSRGVVGS